MKRTLLQMYILGSADAVPFYTFAFSEAPADMQPGTGMQFC